MDYQSIQLIKEFLENTNLSDLSDDDWPLVNLPKNRIEDLPKMQWELLTELLIAKDAGLLQMVVDLVFAVTSVKGAANLTLQFAKSIESLDIKVAKKILEQAKVESWAEIPISLGDTTLLKQYAQEVKAELAKLIDEGGGVTAISEKAGLTQPHLSRLLNDTSIPRTLTLRKIFDALGITVIRIKTRS